MSTTTQSCAVAGGGWPLERVLFAIGGTPGLTSAACLASIVLQRVFGVQRRGAS